MVNPLSGPFPYLGPGAVLVGSICLSIRAGKGYQGGRACRYCRHCSWNLFWSLRGPRDPGQELRPSQSGQEGTTQRMPAEA